MGSEHINPIQLPKVSQKSSFYHSQTLLTVLLSLALCIFLVSALASICVETESWLLGDLGCSVSWCWVIVWVWQLAVEACPTCFSSVTAALIWKSHGGVLLHTELGQGLFPLFGKKKKFIVLSKEKETSSSLILISFCALN